MAGWVLNGNQLTTSDNVGIGTPTPQKPLDVASTGGIRIGETAEASSDNEIYFADNGQIRSLDDNHRIIFNRSGNELELREFGNITFSPGATGGQRTAAATISATGDLYVGGMADFQRNVSAFGIGIGRVAAAAGENEIYFADNGQIRSLDDSHRIIFNRSGNELELREYGVITLSPGATQGQRTAQVVINAAGLSVNDNISANGNITAGGEILAAGLSVNGNISAGGDILLAGADCAEDFDTAETEILEPGTVVVIDQDGTLRESSEAYDTKVAGVVSGAGLYRHGLVLDHRPSEKGRIPVALVGKVYCKVDADYGCIRVGDLLTTSATPGHAMKVIERLNAFGAILGKALQPLERGRGLIPILTALQ